MNMALDLDIPVVKTNAKANFPFAVQVQNTENWNTTEAAVTLAAAKEAAATLHERFPKLPIRIEHATGGMCVVSTLPVFRFRDRVIDLPHKMALWTGKKHPPAIGDTVTLNFNRLGLGIVTGYAVENGYLGVMVKMVDAKGRPDWHKDNLPTNDASIIYGHEIQNG